MTAVLPAKAVSAMSYEVLGELRVSGAPGVSAPRARKVETLLAVLLARANQVVGTDALIAEMWGESPPAKASAALYVHVSQLRKLLRGGVPGVSVLVTNPHGYSLRVADGELDADRFGRLHTRGRALYRDGQFGAAGAALRAAGELWRGPAFGGVVDAPVVLAYAAVLEEARLECVELLMETELRFGRHREVVAVLSTLTREHPLRETFYEQSMKALLRGGRRAEALEVYATARRHLGRQLGIEPGRALRDLQHLVLVGEFDEG